MITYHVLLHLTKYGEANLDATTLRNLLQVVLFDEKAFGKTTATVPASELDDWNAVFADDVAQRRQSRLRIEAELTKRGLSP